MPFFFRLHLGETRSCLRETWSLEIHKKVLWISDGNRPYDVFAFTHPLVADVDRLASR